MVLFAHVGLAMLLASSIAQGAETYAEAYRLASQTGRPMVVLVGAEWCGPCQTMKQNVIPQIRRRGLLGRVAFATVCVDRQRELGKQLTRGGPIPQLLMFRRTYQGWRLSRLTGGQSVGDVEAFIDEGLKRDAAEKKAEVAQTEQAPQAPSDSGEGKSG
ncbi:MAG TPA: thioredoxin family protein [Thermoguttaceae bacterium]|nr:thioredoxin family protein [Thermoguttaceae bacterium]